MKKFFLLPLIIFTFFSCDDSITSTDNVKNMSMEERLATIDANGSVDVNDIKIIRIKTLLKNLSKMYNEPIDSIADLTSRAQGVIHDHGIEETNLNILEEMNKAGKLENTSYRDAVVLYAMIRSRY